MYEPLEQIEYDVLDDDDTVHAFIKEFEQWVKKKGKTSFKSVENFRRKFLDKYQIGFTELLYKMEKDGFLIDYYNNTINSIR